MNLKPNLRVEIAGIKMKNPVMTASGTFGSGLEYSNFIDLSKLGAIVTKGVTLKKQTGNPGPRVYETPCGMLNSIGLQNKGVKNFIAEDLEFLKKFNVPVIVNVAGNTIEEYVAVVEQLSEKDVVKGIELNVSCPNVKSGGLSFGLNVKSAIKLTSAVRKTTKLPLIVKLSPNVGNIDEIAKGVEDAGADAVSLINTILGMAIDPQSFKPQLANIVGGLSGPAIKPVAVGMVWKISKAINIPIIGMGGIMNCYDALEFFLAGAKAVAVGTANFIDPEATIKLIEELEEFLTIKDISDISDIVGQVKV
ncbi:dihydroorotate dehydrogenase [Candidatus Oleimmundimicrobium sp.]|uniref:dihydroorotate dehydrogenase n=1 Tax=Candidatus Oleimmundimicrobium sp. TaxID=3060597 RepID=UPI002716ED95|nr:dihydroorotate dehydrogenase [Candidatus Oleimmundimicrobium sp.]MDO8885414.1 dihydroorotate dehydrogenase [Candidatus Oleimmundimicrobium sp.]